MGNITWRIKQFFRQMMPLAIMAAIAYGGYHLYKRGYFRGGIANSFNRVLHQVPYFGSRFSHYRPGHQSVSRSHHRAHHGKRHHRRHRRHHR